MSVSDSHRKGLTNTRFMIDIAHGFYHTGRTLARDLQNDDSKHGYIWIAPAVVNFSFATELILKAVIHYDTKRKRKGHDLNVLYNSITASTKKEIERSYKEFKIKNEQDKTLSAWKIVVKPKDEADSSDEESNFDEIQNLLNIHRESFINWRYIHEFGQTGYSYEFDFLAMDAFYQALTKALNHFIENEKPTYGLKRTQPPK